MAVAAVGPAWPAPVAGPVPLERRVAHAARMELEARLREARLTEPRIDVSAVAVATAASRARGDAPCSQPPAVEAIDTRQPGRMRFAAVCADGWRQEWIAKATVSAEVVVASADLPANRAISASDMTLQRRDVTALPDALSDPQAAIGRSSRRPLHAGDPLRQGQLVDVVMVRRGDAVRIVATHDAVQVTAAGSALDPGAEGAIVRVRNDRNGNVIRARVTGVGTVEPAEAVMPTASPP